MHLNAIPGETCTSRQLFHTNCTETKTIRDQQCEKHADIRLQNRDDKDEDEPPVKSWRYVRLFFHLWSSLSELSLQDAEEPSLNLFLLISDLTKQRLSFHIPVNKPPSRSTGDKIFSVCGLTKGTEACKKQENDM